MKLKYVFGAKRKKIRMTEKILGKGLFKQKSKIIRAKKNKQTNRQNKTLSDKCKAGFLSITRWVKEKKAKSQCQGIHAPSFPFL